MRVPFKLSNRLKLTLVNMERLKIIRRINELCEWESNLVIVEKPDKTITVCIEN